VAIKVERGEIFHSEPYYQFKISYRVTRNPDKFISKTIVLNALKRSVSYNKKTIKTFELSPDINFFKARWNGFFKKVQFKTSEGATIE